MSKKQSSVEWFASVTAQLGYVSMEILEQAKAMHKEEIMESISSGYEDGIHYASGEHGRYESPEQYYNETFGGSHE